MKKTLSRHLSTISLLPTFALLIMTVLLLIASIRDYSAAKHTYDNALLVQFTSALVHEMQKERGMTAGFIGSKGKKFAEEIVEQRRNVDEKYKQLQEYIPDHDFNETTGNTLQEFNEHLSLLKETRDKVNALSLNLKEALTFYTKANSILLHLNSVLANSASDLEGMQMLNTLYNLAYTKEQSGIERAVLSNAFAAQSFTDSSYKLFHELLTKQKVYFSIAEEVASDGFKTVLTDFKKSEVNQEVEIYRAYALANNTGTLERDAGEWFAVSTARINLLKKKEDLLLAETISSAEAVTSSNMAWLVTYVLFSVFMALLAYVIYSVLQYRQKQSVLIKNVMSSVELEHDISKTIDIVVEDDLGRIAGLLNKTFKRLQIDFRELQRSSSLIAEETEATAEITAQSRLNLQKQQESVARTLSLVESVSKGITNNTDQIKTSAHYAEQSKNSATNGENVVENAVVGIKKTADNIAKVNDEIERVAKNVNDIVGMVDVIHSVADQTNLLALNAAIEAARAGEQGRGFAVVADEVRALAKRTQDSTQEISTIINYLTESSAAATKLIRTGNEQAANSVELAENVHKVLHDIVLNMSQLNDVNQTISSSAEEQLQSIITVTETIREIDVHATENSKGAENVSESTAQLSEIAANMQDQTTRYKVE